ncbi:hypothetical protein PQR34_32345 [Paraburkholderia sediminicola]|uniref:hypothetical protein n=1 Tax=Paraburkholderia sediminicola TaxID=458836 RepID=UPI0038BBBB4D
MDDNITMTIVINPLVSPLLHEALSGYRSARQRAMRLRALAESALREPTQRTRDAGNTQQPDLTALERPGPAPVVPQETGVQVLRIHESATGADGLASGSFREELAGYF